MKPENALQFDCHQNLSELSFIDAICLLGESFASKELKVAIGISGRDIFTASDIASKMNRCVTNLEVVVILDCSYQDYEWTARDLESKVAVWSPGIT